MSQNSNAYFAPSRGSEGGGGRRAHGARYRSGRPGTYPSLATGGRGGGHNWTRYLPRDALQYGLDFEDPVAIQGPSLGPGPISTSCVDQKVVKRMEEAQNRRIMVSKRKQVGDAIKKSVVDRKQEEEKVHTACSQNRITGHQHVLQKLFHDETRRTLIRSALLTMNLDVGLTDDEMLIAFEHLGI